MLCKRTYKNQITLPKRIMEKFGDVEYFDVEEDRDRIILRPVEIKPRVSLARIRKNIASMGLTEKDIEDAISWARKK
jgi:bifunctional DNA-binding transcriptional regulator/antitoxin component of YhaV-PrlF toxin-antitoxin module